MPPNRAPVPCVPVEIAPEIVCASMSPRFVMASPSRSSSALSVCSVVPARTVTRPVSMSAAATPVQPTEVQRDVVRGGDRGERVAAARAPARSCPAARPGSPRRRARRGRAARPRRWPRPTRCPPSYARLSLLPRGPPRSYGGIVPDETHRMRLDAATKHLDPPLAVVDLEAFDHNADDLVRRAAGRPVRVASKSVRCRFLLERVLRRDGFAGVHGVLAAGGAAGCPAGGVGPTSTDVDILVAYPTTDHAALRLLADDTHARARISIMVDSVAHLDLVDAALGYGHAGDPGLPGAGRVLAAAVRARRGARRHAPFPGLHGVAGGLAGEGGARQAGLPARRADGLRGADRGSRRPAGRQTGPGRDPAVDAGPFGAGTGRSAERGRGRGAGLRATWSSSTAAAPAASRRPASTSRSPRSRPARG